MIYAYWKFRYFTWPSKFTVHEVRSRCPWKVRKGLCHIRNDLGSNLSPNRNNNKDTPSDVRKEGDSPPRECPESISREGNEGPVQRESILFFDPLKVHTYGVWKTKWNRSRLLQTLKIIHPLLERIKVRRKRVYSHKTLLKRFRKLFETYRTTNESPTVIMYNLFLNKKPPPLKREIIFTFR